MQHRLPWGAQLAEKKLKEVGLKFIMGSWNCQLQSLKLWKENQPTLSYSCIVWISPPMGNDPWPLFHDRELFGILGGLTFFLGVRDSSSTADGYSWWIVIFRWDVCPTFYQVKQVIELCYNVIMKTGHNQQVILYWEQVMINHSGILY